MNCGAEMKKLVILDFDGTAVDTITDVSLCFNEALRLNHFPQHPLKAFDRFVGGNLETVVSRMLPPEQVTEANITRVKTIYRELYLASSKPNTQPYPGVRELLDDLKAMNVMVAINSNKGQALLDDMVEKMFPPHYFITVVGYQESFPPKPDPYGVNLIIQACNSSEIDAIYIGDGRSDIETAANAGIPCIFVNWGQGTLKETECAQVHARVDTVDQLRSELLKWVQKG